MIRLRDQDYLSRGGAILLGAIIGDIVGSRFERNNYKDKDFELFTEECRVTDDSVMTLAVGKSIIETTNHKRQFFNRYTHEFYKQLSETTVKYMQEIGRKYPDCGYGTMFKKWLFSSDPQPYNSFGNGAAMRVSAVGLIAQSELEVIDLAEAVTKVTHNHEEGIKGATATAMAIYLANNGAKKQVIKSQIERDYYDLNFKIDDIRETYSFDATCQGSVPQAIKCFLESGTFEDAIRTAISLGGDSDTIGAITGSIAEAYYGVPIELEEKALEYLDDYLLGLYYEWTDTMDNYI